MRQRLRVAGTLAAGLAFFLGSCGTLLYPERRGQPAVRYFFSGSPSPSLTTLPSSIMPRWWPAPRRPSIKYRVRTAGPVAQGPRIAVVALDDQAGLHQRG